MNDQDSYSLYCAMLLQEYRQQGAALNGIDPSILEACQSYLNSSNLLYSNNNKEVCV